LDKDNPQVVQAKPQNMKAVLSAEPTVDDYTLLIKRLHRRRTRAAAAQVHMTQPLPTRVNVTRNVSPNRSLFGGQSIQMLEDNRATTEFDGRSTKYSNLVSTPFIAHSVVKRIVQAPWQRPVTEARRRSGRLQQGSMVLIASTRI
jgi:hypothetical protein